MSCAESERLENPAAADFHAVFLAAPSALALASADPVPRVISANPAFAALLGIPELALEGRRLDQVFRATAAEQVRRAFDQCRLTGAPVRLRIAHAPADHLVRLQIELRPRPSGSGVVLEVRQLDRALALAELGEAGVLAEVGALSRGMVYIHDVPRRELRHSDHPLAGRLGFTGLPIDLGRFREMIHPEDFARFVVHGEEAVAAADNRLVRGTYRVLAADGGWLWLDLRTRVFARGPEGEVKRLIGVATDVTQAHTHAAALSDAATALAHAEIAERRRIGRELHDSTAQQLVAARLGLGALERHLGPESDATGLLDDVRRAVASAQQEIRNFSYMLHPPSLQQEGLERTLRAFAAGFARRTGLTISVRVARQCCPLPFPVEVALFRVSQEALMNVYRHARASHAWLRLSLEGKLVVLEVEDNGVGLGPCPKPAKQAGVGVSGMEARMLQLGGRFELSPGRVGVKVRAAVAAERPEL